MYQLNGKLNNRYNLGSKAYEHARFSEEKYGAVAYWMAIQFDVQEYSVYWGSLGVLSGSRAIPIDKCMSGSVGEVLVRKKRHYFDFEYYTNSKRK